MKRIVQQTKDKVTESTTSRTTTYNNSIENLFQHQTSEPLLEKVFGDDEATTQVKAQLEIHLPVPSSSSNSTDCYHRVIEKPTNQKPETKKKKFFFQIHQYPILHFGTILEI